MCFHSFQIVFSLFKSAPPCSSIPHMKFPKPLLLVFLLLNSLPLHSEEILEISTADQLSVINTLITSSDWTTLLHLSTLGLAQPPGTSPILFPYYVGVAKYGLGDLPGSVESFRIAVVLAPESSLVRGSLGEALLASFECEEASEAFGTAIELRRIEGNDGHGHGHDYLTGDGIRWVTKRRKARNWVANWATSEEEDEEEERIRRFVAQSDRVELEKMQLSFGDVTDVLDDGATRRHFRRTVGVEEREVESVNADANAIAINAGGRLNVGFLR